MLTRAWLRPSTRYCETSGPGDRGSRVPGVGMTMNAKPRRSTARMPAPAPIRSHVRGRPVTSIVGWSSVREMLMGELSARPTPQLEVRGCLFQHRGELALGRLAAVGDVLSGPQALMGPVVLQHLPGHCHAVNLVGPVVDPRRAGVPVHRLEGQVGREPE